MVKLYMEAWMGNILEKEAMLVLMPSSMSWAPAVGEIRITHSTQGDRGSSYKWNLDLESEPISVGIIMSRVEGTMYK